MVMGNTLRDRDVQYVASKDDTTHTWRILNTWSDELKNLGVEDDVPDDSGAVKILTEGEFISLIKEAARLGVLENATFGTGEAELENIILDKDKEILELKDKLRELKDETSKIVRDNTHTEEYVLKEKAINSGYELKEKAMDNILKLVSIQDVSNLSIE